jgi:hypothetical protein
MPSSMNITFPALDPSHQMYLTKSFNGENFIDPPRGYPKIQMGSAPAMAVNGQLYVGFKANDKSNILYVTSSKDGESFQAPATGYPKIVMASAPALATYNGLLYVAYRDPKNLLTVASSATQFNSPQGLNITVSSAPSMVAFKDNLYIAFKLDDTLHLTWSPFGNQWVTPAVPQRNVPTSLGPALAVFNDKLYAAGRSTDGADFLTLAWSSDGRTFQNPIRFPNIQIRTTPAIAVFNGSLFIAWESYDSSHTLYVVSSRDGKNFTEPRAETVGLIGGSPGMVSFQN